MIGRMHTRSGILEGGVLNSLGTLGAQVIHPGSPNASVLFRAVSS